MTFRHPENYYIYKYSVLQAITSAFNVDQASDRLTTYKQICDAIREVASTDKELITMSHKRLGSDCYQDPDNRMLAMDIAYFVFQLQRAKAEAQKLAARPAVVLEFEKWLEAPTRNNGKPYDYKTVRVYLKQTEAEAKKLAPKYNGNINLFTYDTSELFAPQHESLMQIINLGETQVNKAYPKVLRLYAQFLKERESLIPRGPEPLVTTPVTKVNAPLEHGPHPVLRFGGRSRQASRTGEKGRAEPLLRPVYQQNASVLKNLLTLSQSAVTYSMAIPLRMSSWCRIFQKWGV